ncbi:uncharacterized protein TNCV_377291 [Trichonephila clavipes]|nr:uncharacterized protein TNCV_377291 [Trichonephila clavipes]
MKNATTRRNSDLASLYDMLETKLRALESLRRTKEKCADFLEHLVESCLPESVLCVWKRRRISEDDDSTCVPNESSENENYLSNNNYTDEIDVDSSVQTVLSLYVNDISLKESWEIDSLCNRCPVENVSKMRFFDVQLKEFHEELTVLPDGRFRMFSIGLSADIEKSFLQIGIAPDDRDYLRFLYPSNEREIYRHSRVVFGCKRGCQELASICEGWESNFPREYMCKSSGVTRVLDASKKAYAAYIFVRSVNSVGVKVTLVRAKCRVSPLKTLSIPYLELMACCTGARLASLLVAPRFFGAEKGKFFATKSRSEA